MTTPGAPYQNRTDAGHRIADALTSYVSSSVTVLALPRGGVPVASVIADRLLAPLDILVVRKIGAPGDREYALGAVSEGGIRFLDRERMQALGLTPADLGSEIRARTEEVDQLARRLRGGGAAPRLEGRTVVVVDDGMATGATVRSAVQSVRLQRPERVVVAVGVSSAQAIEALRPLVDEVVAPLVPPRLFAVGEWYRDFPQVSEAEVIEILARHRRAVTEGPQHGGSGP
jgi:putative phosphoribosyl transferase